MFAAFDQRSDVEAGKRLFSERLLSGGNDDHGAADRGVSDQAFDRPAKHRLAAQQPILLGQPAAEALAFAGRDNEGGGSHGRRL